MLDIYGNARRGAHPGAGAIQAGISVDEFIASLQRLRAKLARLNLHDPPGYVPPRLGEPLPKRRAGADAPQRRWGQRPQRLAAALGVAGARLGASLGSVGPPFALPLGDLPRAAASTQSRGDDLGDSPRRLPCFIASGA